MKSLTNLLATVMVFLIFGSAQFANGADNGKTAIGRLTGNQKFQFTFLNKARLIYNFNELSPRYSEIAFLPPDNQMAAHLFSGRINLITFKSDDSVKDPTAMMINGNVVSFEHTNGVAAIVDVDGNHYLISQVGRGMGLPIMENADPSVTKWKVRSDIGVKKRDIYFLVIGSDTHKTEAIVIDYAKHTAIIVKFNGIHDNINSDKISFGRNQDGVLFIKSTDPKVVVSAGVEGSLEKLQLTEKMLTQANLDSIVKGKIEKNAAMTLLTHPGAVSVTGKTNPPVGLLDSKTGPAPTPIQKFEDAQVHLPQFREHLEKYIINQPEVVEALYKIELRKSVYKEKLMEPLHIYMMGLPGTGKDVSAETFVDALNQQKGAHQENLFKMPVANDEMSISSIRGSGTGYIGSDTVSEFNRWLVKHSGGKYILKTSEEGNDKTMYIEENPAWKPGMVLAGYEDPDKAAIFVNEFHNWSKEAKDLIIKQALEHGYYEIKNPGKGIGRIFTNITLIFASNEGTGLLSPRKQNGERAASRSLSFEALQKNWEATHNSQQLLDREIMKTNGLVGSGKEPRGISEEVANRLTNKILLRPQSPASLQIIAGTYMDRIKDLLGDIVNVTWQPETLAFIQAYDYDAEKNARPLKGRVESLIEATLLDAVSDKRISLTDGSGEKATLNIGVKINADKTTSLVVAISGKVTDILIPFTEKDKPAVLMTDAEINHLFTLPARIQTHVFGADHVIQKVGDNIATRAERQTSSRDIEKATTPALKYMFLGPSSTGKTETAKAIAIEHFGSEENMKIFDFSQIKTLDDLKTKILGSKDDRGNSFASEFMQEYDAQQGKVLFVFDEFANSNREVLKALYDIFREPVVRTFSDGVPRVMSNVIVVMTGNAGEEWYKDIPKEIPDIEQQAAMDEIYAKAMENPGARRRTLEIYFSPALVNRVGENNIFFFAPLNFKAIRQLTQLKLSAALDRIATTEGQHRWKIQFSTTDDLIKTIVDIENEGYILLEQGASIDRYVKDDFEEGIRKVLLKNLTPDGATITLEHLGATIDPVTHRSSLNYNLHVAGKKEPVKYSVLNRVTSRHTTNNPYETIGTAYHEAGHELVRHILFGDRFQSVEISIIPGVTEIGNAWIRYLGIARFDQLIHLSYSREVVIRHMAVFAAGEVAQSLVTEGNYSDAGKSNDMERSTKLAQAAILKWGLSKEFGVEAVPEGMTADDYMKAFSPEKRSLYEAELKKMLVEARNMARAVLLSNMEHALIPMGTQLATVGRLDQHDLIKFYETHGPKLDSTSFSALMVDIPAQDKLAKSWESEKPNTSRTIEMKFHDKIPIPKTIANINDIVTKRKADAVASVPLPAHIPIANPNGGGDGNRGGSRSGSDSGNEAVNKASGDSWSSTASSSFGRWSVTSSTPNCRNVFTNSSR